MARYELVSQCGFALGVVKVDVDAFHVFACLVVECVVIMRAPFFMFLALSSSLMSCFRALSIFSSDHGESVNQLFRADWLLWHTKLSLGSLRLLFMAVTVLLSQTIMPVRYLANCFSWGLLKSCFIFGRKSLMMLG